MLKTTDILTLFEPRLGDFGPLCLAGGAVRDELLGRTPKDFDLFCLWTSEWDFKSIRETLSSRLDGLAISEPSVEWHKSEPYLVANVKIDGADVQVMANPAATPEALVDTFDWSVCLFARTADQLIQRTPLEEIGHGKELKLQKVTFPLSTLRRGFRFSERFKMQLRREDINLLCSKIIENQKTGNEVSPSGNEPDMPSLEANTLLN